MSEIFKGYYTINLSKKRIVSAATNIGSRMNLGAKLPYYNSTSSDILTTITFHTASLSLTVATIS